MVLLVFLASGCQEQHLITSKKYFDTVEDIFNEKKALALNRENELFDVLNSSLDISQTEALKYLFAFMPLSDLADYNGEFFLANADVALRTRNEAPWGKKIPEEIFLHYVLPCRVNNENLDSFRIVYYDEIKERIMGMSMEQAALEINHWCHEKVTYQPADIRTSGPMSTILSARGRCGEESTFTVSAMRTAGIPARQVYTPRWAHTDDNHAWVEIWIDGDWFYMGACEPEPVLDRGWFTEPARRAMLVHTKSFGAPYGNENVINSHTDYTEVNNLSKYAVTKRLFVSVVDRQGNPAKDAIVEYLLYNYAEFYPIARVAADDNGISSFETGLGDLIVWARKGDDFSYEKISVADVDTVILKLDMEPKGSGSIALDLKAPVLRSPLDGPSQELLEKNSERVASENEIREKYVGTWMKPSDYQSFAVKIGSDPGMIGGILARSMGNFKTIISFLENKSGKELEMALSLLNVVAEKDLRDTKLQILEDHLKNVAIPAGIDTRDELFVKYVLNPRVANEMLVSWRSSLKSEIQEFAEEAVNNPLVIKNYVEKTIMISDTGNYYGTPLTPIGVHQLKVSDPESRSFYFVAICRSLGIPSRLEPGSNTPQYWFNSVWNDVFFRSGKTPSGSKGYLRLFSSDANPVPEYYVHFTIAHFQDGRYNTLEYDYNRRITDFNGELQLTPGHYMLVTGNRINDGRVLSEILFFDLAENQHLALEIKLRKEVRAPEANR